MPRDILSSKKKTVGYSARHTKQGSFSQDKLLDLIQTNYDDMNVRWLDLAEFLAMRVGLWGCGDCGCCVLRFASADFVSHVCGAASPMCSALR